MGEEYGAILHKNSVMMNKEFVQCGGRENKPNLNR